MNGDLAILTLAHGWIATSRLLVTLLGADRHR